MIYKSFLFEEIQPRTGVTLCIDYINNLQLAVNNLELVQCVTPQLNRW